MDEDEFIEQYKNDTNKSSVMDVVYNALVEYCRENNIDENELSTDQLENIAKRMIREGNF